MLLARAVEGVGGEPREGQLTMAQAVEQAMVTGQHLLVQAGTGTGKSLAYLVPAIRHALAERAGAAAGASSEPGSGKAPASTADGVRPPAGGGPVVVATATIALQRQLVERDLPRLVESLAPALSTAPTFAILKGRRNYLCLERFHAGPQDEQGGLFDGDDTSGAASSTHALPAATSGLGREVVRIAEWANRTDTGDRDELVPGVSERAWGQVAVSSRECLGASRCPYGTDCFAEGARMQAMRSDVVVTNHALLAIDALSDVEVLPDHDVVVIDEAHELVDRVTGVATEELTAGIVDRAATRARRLAPEESAQLDEAGAALADISANLPTGRLSPLPVALVEVLALVRDAARLTVGAMSATESAAGKTSAGVDAADAEVVRRQARIAVEAVHDTAQRILTDSEHDVIWAASEERRGVVLRVAPLQVAKLLHDTLFSQRTVVLTSATLSLGGSFDPIAAGLGLGLGATVAAGAKETWRGLDVGSPFEHARQGILYVAKHLPPPGRDGLAASTLTELAELIEAAGGRTLGLFSSMRAAVEAADAMRSRVDVPILCQGEDSTGELVRRFAADPKACLFGTLSLWQGVDVQGASCQLVVVDRIPFPRPDDPLMSARQKAVAEAGGNGFMAVAAAQAALLLAQGTGRLLRSRTDRGVVAVLDSRLATARYAGFLRASLPPFWFTTDPDVVKASLRALDEAAGGARKPVEAIQPTLDAV
ncbi:MAG: ATP-dependent helicase DinG [Actinomycetota bacterium]|nr:ATP-dependent helicase DinG [Actinomycetota bacterium]